jgi:hypothetical protein
MRVKQVPIRNYALLGKIATYGHCVFNKVKKPRPKPGNGPHGVGEASSIRILLAAATLLAAALLAAALARLLLLLAGSLSAAALLSALSGLLVLLTALTALLIAAGIIGICH